MGGQRSAEEWKFGEGWAEDGKTTGMNGESRAGALTRIRTRRIDEAFIWGERAGANQLG